MGPAISRLSSDEILRENHRTLQSKQQADNAHPCADIKTWHQFYQDIPQNEKRRTSPFKVNRSINDKVSLWKGDITSLAVDAIVNSAAKPHKGEVNLAILNKAGNYFKAECLLVGIGEPGKPNLIGGYNLKAKHVINTLAPQHKERDILEDCYRNSLNTAKENDLRTIAIPCIATRMRNKFSHEDAANIALQVIRDWMEENHNAVDRVVICVYQKVDLNIYKRLMQKYFPILSSTDVTEDDSSRRRPPPIDDTLERSMQTEFVSPGDSTLERSMQTETPNPSDSVLERSMQTDLSPSGESLLERSMQTETPSSSTRPRAPEYVNITPELLGAIGGGVNSNRNSTEKTIHPLETWRNNTRTADGKQRIIISRTSEKGVFKQLMELYSGKGDIDFTKTPEIIYIGEEGKDLGAVTKEYFLESLNSLVTVYLHGSSPAFEGEMDHRLPCPSKVHLHQQIFHTVGKLLAHSVLHSSLGFVGMSPVIVHLLTHDIGFDDLDASGIQIDLEDLPDDKMRKLLSVKNPADLSGKQKRELIDVMTDSNLGYLPIENDTLQYITQEVLTYEVVTRRWPQIQAIRKGMDSIRRAPEGVGLYTFLCQNPSTDNVRAVFLSQDDLHIDPEMLLSKVVREGHDDDHVFEYFKRVVQDLHQKQMGAESLNSLLVFWTAEPVLPSDGGMTVETDFRRDLPLAHTCLRNLVLPGSLTDYDKFRQAFRLALENGKGFGLM